MENSRQPRKIPNGCVPVVQATERFLVGTWAAKLSDFGFVCRWCRTVFSSSLLLLSLELSDTKVYEP